MRKLGVALSVGLAVLALPKIASAFCGFYVSGADAKLFNDATQVALMREGTRTALSMQNSYKGPPENFAMVVPVPVVLQKENVKTLKKELFQKLDTLSAPRLVEYWEQDPCFIPPPTEAMPMQPQAAPPPMSAAAGPASFGVKIEAQFTVGEYEIVILSAKDSGGLDAWLRQEKYKIPAGAEPYLKPYVQAGSKFFVARVDVKKVSFTPEGVAELSPLRFHYDTNEFSLPVRLGLINSSGTQDLIIHVVGKNQRYEPANYPSVTIPTNLDLAETAKDNFGSFYASLFDRTLEKKPKSIITEYSWDASSCDPCPGPTLDANDLASLGADVMPSAKPPAPPPAPQPRPGTPPPTTTGPAPKGAPPSPPRGPMPPPPPPGFFIQPWGWTLTRLHARYSKDALGADIVFKAATPIVGGREVRGANGALENGSSPSQINNFQGRYAMRHAWTGPIACQNPQRGIWGGPPSWVASSGSRSQPIAATKIATAKRGTQLAMSLRSDVPELDVKAAGVAPSGIGPAPSASASPPPPTTPPPATSTSPTVPEAPKSGGCAGCATATSNMDDAMPIGIAIALASAMRWRRRSKRLPD